MKRFKFVLIVLFLIINSAIVFAQTDTETNKIQSPEILPTEIRESIVQRMVIISVISPQKDGSNRLFYGQGILIQSNTILTVKHLIGNTLSDTQIVVIYFSGIKKFFKLSPKDLICYSSDIVDLTVIKLDKLTEIEKSALPQVEPIKFSTVQPTELVFMPCLLLHRSVKIKHAFWVELFFSGKIVNLVLSDKKHFYIDILASKGISGSGIFNKNGYLSGIAFACFQINSHIQVAVAINSYQIRTFLKTIKTKR